MEKRASGILLHITSLPSRFGIGDLGPWAFRFADFLHGSRQRYWQILPLNPTDSAHGNSPYHSDSAFACNLLLISPEALVEEGLLSNDELPQAVGLPENRVDYQKVSTFKRELLAHAFLRFDQVKGKDDFLVFCSGNSPWLDDYSLFRVLKSHFNGRPWTAWPADVRERDEQALRSARETFREQIEREVFFQYLVSRQWHALKEYCNQMGVQIIGDLPFYVTHDSADVWCNPRMFNLDKDGNPAVVAGVPPDYFSETGQLWGNPVYQWDVLRDQGYHWWMERVKRNLNLFDYVRVDHFRGFASYWEIPAGEETAVNGKWVEGPADDFFHTLADSVRLGSIIAEDLGYITADVTQLMERFSLPGMKLLIFAFEDDVAGNPYAPHNHTENCLVYTGTHDNTTIRGWFDNELGDEGKARVARYLGRSVRPDEISREMVRFAMMSVARTAILPMQDLLGLGAEARMNTPASRDGNWEWRLGREHLSEENIRSLCHMTETYGRV